MSELTIEQLAADCHIRLDDDEFGTPPLWLVYNEIMRLRAALADLRAKLAAAEARVKRLEQALEEQHHATDQLWNERAADDARARLAAERKAGAEWMRLLVVDILNQTAESAEGAEWAGPWRNQAAKLIRAKAEFIRDMEIDEAAAQPQAAETGTKTK